MDEVLSPGSTPCKYLCSVQATCSLPLTVKQEGFSDDQQTELSKLNRRTQVACNSIRYLAGDTAAAGGSPRIWQDYGRTNGREVHRDVSGSRTHNKGRYCYFFEGKGCKFCNMIEKNMFYGF